MRHITLFIVVVLTLGLSIVAGQLLGPVAGAVVCWIGAAGTMLYLLFRNEE